MFNFIYLYKNENVFIFSMYSRLLSMNFIPRLAFKSLLNYRIILNCNNKFAIEELVEIKTSPLKMCPDLREDFYYLGLSLPVR